MAFKINTVKTGEVVLYVNFRIFQQDLHNQKEKKTKSKKGQWKKQIYLYVMHIHIYIYTQIDKSFIKKETPCSPKTELRV